MKELIDWLSKNSWNKFSAKSFHIQAGQLVVPSDTTNLPYPGTLFLDESSTIGVVTVELLGDDPGMSHVINLQKGSSGAVYDSMIVRKVYSTGRIATIIYVNPIR